MNARVDALTATPEWFMPWRTIANEHDRPALEFELEKVVRGLFRPDLFLDYIRYFVLFEADGDALIKKIAGYHQFHGVREAVRVTLIAAAEESSRLREDPLRATYGERVVPGSRKARVFWHTQGSGKSISMCCYTGKLLQQPEMNNPTLVVVADRNDLDGQLYQQFCAAKDLLKQTPEQALKRNEELGLNPAEVAFYDALAERPEVLQTMGDETLKKLATELTEKLRSSTTVDWQVRDSVRASMRLLIKRLLRKYKYPPEGQEAAISMVLKQAEALADSWSTR